MTEKEAIKELEEKYMRISTGMDYEKCTKHNQAISEAIKALMEARRYRKMQRKLKNVYGKYDGLLEAMVDLLVEHPGIDMPDPIQKSVLLTDEDVDRWEAYKAIGTVEECRTAIENQKGDLGGETNE